MSAGKLAETLNWKSPYSHSLPNTCWEGVWKGGGFNLFSFSALPGEDDPNLTSIFFRWVAQPPTRQEHPRKLGSVVGKWVISPTYINGVYWGYNPPILTFDPNFLGHPNRRTSPKHSNEARITGSGIFSTTGAESLGGKEVPCGWSSGEGFHLPIRIHGWYIFLPGPCKGVPNWWELGCHLATP